MRTPVALFTAVLFLFTAAPFVEAGSPPKTFCNPLNLDYGLVQMRKEPFHRHGADPVIVLFKDKYWLFSTWDKPGYRVSDDLVNWRYIPFPSRVDLVDKKWYTAAAATVIDGWLYFTEFGSPRKNKVGLYRTQDPDGGEWEWVRDFDTPYADPCLFVDAPSGRVFMYWGLEKPIRGVELDPKTFLEVPGTERQLMETFNPQEKIRDGWEVCTWDNNEASPGMRGNKSFVPCREGSWMTFLNGKYYLQYASPGTTVPGYADGLLTGDSPLGPFTYSQHSPISRKASGFITSAGHSCLFQDKHGNWWRAVTMLIGVHERMERRIGLFPAGFDSDGVPYTRTELGDLPILLADGKRDHAAEVYAGWWRLPVTEVTASSSLSDHPPALSSDKNIRTWWSAETGRVGEWLQIDFGEEHELRAVQVNLTEQDVDPEIVAKKEFKDYHRFSVGASRDGINYTTVMERSLGQEVTPHQYHQFDEPIRARYLKLRNFRTPGGGKFAVSELRAFGVAKGEKPGVVKDFAVVRDPEDRRKAKLTWTPADGAASYLIRYGLSADKLYQHDLASGGGQSSLTLYNLNRDPHYVFRIHAMNASGMTSGTKLIDAP